MAGLSQGADVSFIIIIIIIDSPYSRRLLACLTCLKELYLDILHPESYIQLVKFSYNMVSDMVWYAKLSLVSIMHYILDYPQKSK